MVQRTKKTCSIDGCEKPVRARGYCNSHYSQWRRKHNPRRCSIENCDRPVAGRGWCDMHWQRWQKSGDPLITEIYNDPEEAFSNRAQASGNCLLWTGALSPKGYGAIVVYGQTKAAHRYAWERVNGRIPDGMQIDHICHNRACVKAEHLRLADASENSAHRSGPTSDNASGYRNVYAKGNEWSVQIRKHGKLHYFGSYDTPDEAAEVADRERRRLFGEYAGKG